MGWSHIPDMDTSAATSEDNPFVSPKTQASGKVSVQIPTNDWLCRKLSKLNLALVDGYPFRSSKLLVSSMTSFSDQQNRNPRGMGCISTRKLTVLLCHDGTLMPHI